MGEPGRDRAPSPVRLGDSATRQEVPVGGYHLAQPDGPPWPKGV